MPDLRRIRLQHMHRGGARRAQASVTPGTASGHRSPESHDVGSRQDVLDVRAGLRRVQLRKARVRGVREVLVLRAFLCQWQAATD